MTSEGNNRGCVFTVTFPVSSPATAPSQPSGRRTSYLSPARSSMVGGWCSDEPLLVALPGGDKSAVPKDAGGSILPFLGDLTAGEVNGNAARSSSTVLSSMRHTFSDSVLRDNQDQGSVGQSTFPNSAATIGTTKTGFLSHDGIPLIRGDVSDQIVVYDLGSASSPTSSFCRFEDKETERKDDAIFDSGHLPRVLVVDDALSNRKMLCRVLRSRCSAVLQASDGQEAVNLVEESLRTSDSKTRNKSEFDLILMDFVMPVMDGPTAIREIRRLGYSGLIFGLTGNVLEGDKELFLSNGADFVLTKPFNMEVFEQALREHQVPWNKTSVHSLESGKSENFDFRSTKNSRIKKKGVDGRETATFWFGSPSKPLHRRVHSSV